MKQQEPITTPQCQTRGPQPLSGPLKKLVALEEKNCKHVCVMIAGPINYPAAKVFTASNLKVFAHSIKTYSFGECVPFELGWCETKEAATAVKNAIGTYLMANYQLFEAGALGFYRVEKGFEVTMAFQHGVREAGVTVLTHEQRQQDLHAKALRKERQLIEETNKLMGLK